jgi:hypothetical protein
MTAKMEQLQWLVRLGDGAVLVIQLLFMWMAVFHLIYAGHHVKRHPVEEERVNTGWRIVMNVVLIPFTYTMAILMPM